ncbi:MAG: hypothetical protein GDA36_07120, partial [Rhodobacteraceae bacterium]|nr:hypothetical protein [Paracoccaceae bacterium]
MLPGGVQGWFYAPVVARFVSNAVRIGELAQVPSTAVGFHAVLRPRPDLRLCPMRRPIAVFVTCDDLLAGGCRQIGDHGLQRYSIDTT